MRTWLYRLLGALLVPGILLVLGESLYTLLAQTPTPEFLLVRNDGSYPLNFVPLVTLPLMLLWFAGYLLRPLLARWIESPWLARGYFGLLTLLCLTTVMYAYVAHDAYHVHIWFMLALQALLAPAVVGYLTYVLPVPSGYKLPWVREKVTAEETGPQ